MERDAVGKVEMLNFVMQQKEQLLEEIKRLEQDKLIAKQQLEVGTSSGHLTWYIHSSAVRSHYLIHSFVHSFIHSYQDALYDLSKETGKRRDAEVRMNLYCGANDEVLVTLNE